MMLPHSLYDLKVGFSASLSLFYSSSLGSIQVAVRKLLKEGLIELHERSPKGRGKITYRITEAGRQYFLDQLTAPIPQARMEETILARYHFLGLVEREKRLEVMRFLIQTIEASLNELLAVKATYANVAFPPEWREVAHYRLATADYGIAAHQTGLDWFRGQLERELEQAQKPS